jgi:hypothetical protein
MLVKKGVRAKAGGKETLLISSSLGGTGKLILSVLESGPSPIDLEMILRFHSLTSKSACSTSHSPQELFGLSSISPHTVLQSPCPAFPSDREFWSISSRVLQL